MTVPASSPMTTPRTPLVILSTFVLVALTLGWLIGLPLVLMTTEERSTAPLGVFYNLFILTPAVAALLAHLLERRQPLSVLYGHHAEKHAGGTPAGQASDAPAGQVGDDPIAQAGDDPIAQASHDPAAQVSDDPIAQASHGASALERPARMLKPQSVTDALGITPLRPVRRLLGWSVLALLLFFFFSLAALPLGGALGLYPFDPSMPLFVQDLSSRLGVDATEFIASGVLVEVGVIFTAAVLGVFLHAGIEMGWRGYLFPRLQLRWGPLAAVVLTGVISGLWYAPLLAAGFFYDQTPVFEALALMLAFSTIIGGVLAWLRMQSGSIWPAAFAQSMISAAAILHFWFASPGVMVDLRQATLQGVSGWILPGLLLLGLLIFARRAFPQVTIR